MVLVKNFLIKFRNPHRRNLQGPLIFRFTSAFLWVPVNFIWFIFVAPDYARKVFEPDLELGAVLTKGGHTVRTRYGITDPSRPEKWVIESYDVNINSMGFRGEEVLPEDKNKLRVVALGDSSTLGAGEGGADTLFD